MPDLTIQAVGVQEGNVQEATLIRDGLGALAEVRLFKSTFAPSPALNDAAFLGGECDFHGYNHVVVLVWDPVGVESGTPRAFFTNGTSLLFQNDDGSVGNDVGGAWLRYNETGPPAVHKVVEYVVFDPPIPMNAALSTMNMEWKVRVPGPGEVSVSY